MDDIRFSHNGANGPESKMTRVLSCSSGGSTGGEVAVYDCRHVVHVVPSLFTTT